MRTIALSGSDAEESEETGDARTLWMGDLAPWMDESFLLGLFQGTGSLVTVKVIRNKATQKSECYGFIEFAKGSAAQAVLNTFNSQPIPNTKQTFRLNWAACGATKALVEAGGPDHSVFVGDLAPDVTDYVLQESFRQFFPSVRSAKVITDPVTGRSKGYGFVRFGSEGERDRALGDMMGHLISNRPIRVSIATAKKNPSGMPSANAVSANAPHPSDFDPTNTTLFIGGLSASVTEEQLHALFGRFGEIIYVKVPPGKGCGFVQYVHRPVAETAMKAMQSQALGGAPIRISWGRSSSAAGRGASAAAAPSFSQYPSAATPYSGYSGYEGTPYAGYSGGVHASAHDPFAAYHSYSQHAQPQHSSAEASAYQQAFQPQQGLYSGQHLGAAAGTVTGSSSLHAHITGGSLASPDSLFDPLAALDVDKLNAAYMARHTGPLIGSHMHQH
ncbi:hypothetical protein WJX73_001938 [Symbiochloris irregularis]|uniref:RRM domain-containing protein n=1 Tax=Symbiochloris irregularis TaxID=706552 RepID=A0AAW1PV88_9CHLO